MPFVPERPRAGWRNGSVEVMLMDSVPGDLVAMLERAGWHPGRQVGVGEITDSLRSLEFDVSDAAIAFLSQFAFLYLLHEPSILLGEERSFCWTRFDPTSVATLRDARIARRCAEIVGKSLCPVGTDGFHFTIYIADDCSFFAGRDASVYSYGRTSFELLRLIRDGRRPAHLGEWSVG